MVAGTVDVRRVQEGGDLVHLLARSHAAEENRSGSRAAHGARASELHAAVSRDARISGRNSDREARRLVLAGVRAVEPVTEATRAQAAHGEVQIVVQELPPLHQHVRILRVVAHATRRHQSSGHESGVRHRVGLRPANRRVEAVLVNRTEQAAKRRQRRTPHRVLQVVARAVVRAVRAVEANIRTVVDSSMRTAAGQVSDHVHVGGREQVKEAVALVADVHRLHLLHVLVNELDRAFENLCRARDLLRGRGREAEQRQQVARFARLWWREELRDAGIQGAVHAVNRLVDRRVHHLVFHSIPRWRNCESIKERTVAERTLTLTASCHNSLSYNAGQNVSDTFPFMPFLRNNIAWEKGGGGGGDGR